MKSKIVLTCLLAIFMIECKTPRNLPTYDKLSVNEFGAYIKVIHRTSYDIEGELIAIDSNTIVVLNEEDSNCVAIPVTEVKRFKLICAKQKRYGWSIPLGLGLPFIHGAYSLLTFPLHLIVTISVTATGQRAFKYKDEELNYKKLSMFARFPQGIPENLSLTKIK